MDPPITDSGVNQEKFEEVKEAPPLFRCDLFDSEVVHKIGQVLLLGLSTACVDNTTGDLFKGPALVAVDIKKEMVEYLTQRSETYVAESVVQEGGPDAETSDHPTEIVSDFVDDFTSSKRNLLGRVSGWVLSERREDKIDDFVQEMELSKFWLTDRREAIARTLLKNIDFKSAFNCEKKFYTAEELDEHKKQCIFRSIICESEGCSATFCALHKEKHDALCTFKVLPCEQGCEESIMRHEMDRHCITVCPMKLINCPFYSLGCQSTAPVCKIDLHLSEFLQSHIQSILQTIHKEATAEDLKYRIEQLEKSSSLRPLSEIRAVRTLTLAVKVRDAKLGPLEHVSIGVSEESTETPNKVDEERLETPIKGGEESPKTPNKVSEESPKATNKLEEESPKTSSKATEESTKSSIVSGESSKTPDKVSEESPKTTNKLNEESPKSPGKATEDSGKTPLSKVDKESPKTSSSNSSEESPKTPNNKVSEEISKTTSRVNEDSPKSPGKATEDSGKTPLGKVDKESPKTSSSNSSEESPKTPNKVSEEISKTTSRVNEDSPTPSKASEESPKSPVMVSKEENPKTPSTKSSEDSPKIMNLVTNVSEESENQT